MATDGSIKISTELDSKKAEKAMSRFSSYAKTAMAGVKTAIVTGSAAITAMAGYSVKVGSDFEAAMSKVSAISGATGDDLQKLTEKAKEMGAKTKFSATESAQAFEYMAMAGWKTDDMLNGIEGIMNLAAASGEDLATTSDIVTDALTAMGLQASDSGHFADVLAAASSNSNTNVGMMGETFKYVAPVAGALGYNIEDLSQAIGLMANSGIKSTQAGTALRSILTRLAKPPKEAAAAMEKYDISMKNSDGSMKSLMEVMENMRDSLRGLPKDEKAAAAAALGGQEAMSGLLSIVNASDTDFKKLASSIKNADGASEKMANTMNDNLKGSITIGKARSAGKGNADAANKGAGSVNPNGTGGKFGTQYSSGVSSKTRQANSGGKSLGNNAKSGAGSVSGHDPGYNFGKGFVGGIGSWIKGAASKAAEMAKAAYKAAKHALDEHSPSKLTRKLGRWFSEGFGLGIDDEAKSAVQSAEAVAEKAVSAIDAEAIADKLKGLTWQK